MTRWPVLEVDLAGPPQVLPPGAPVVRCLVRWGTAFLGETDVQPGRRTPAAVHADLLDDFRDQVSAVQLVPVTEPVHAASDVTVAVLVRDAARALDLDRCLDALAALQPRPGEVLVVGTEGRCGTRTVDVPTGDSPLRAAAQACRTAVLLVTDERSRALPGWVDAVRRGFDVPEVAALTGPVVPGELEHSTQVLVDRHLRDRSPARLAPRLHTARTDTGLGRPPGETGACLAVRRDVVLGLEAPGAAVREVEDVDLVVRLLAAGHVVLSAPDALVLRTPARTVPQLLKERWAVGAARATLLASCAARGGQWVPAVAAERSLLRRKAARTAAGALRHRQWLRLAATLVELHGGRTGAREPATEGP